ncbi:MAG: imidazole glycerol phosphate synthase subunit HisH [Gammaproteobacteria bacterium]|nr:imidazole glycerol phosphate synthase subunit HisH [Gammaproteobacteria bacterium]MDH3856872.1 imidazole glycerol phosphate synthase subunit HisH [Gammaproteobacteria bacterium]
MQTIAVVDYGMGNLRSVVNALEVVTDGKDQVILTSTAQQVLDADRVVFPGQGAAGDCMRAIDDYGLREAILIAAAEQPFLGICMGMQVLVDRSEENQGTACLGFFEGQVKYFGDGHKDQSGVKLKIPHMGWNRVTQIQSHPLWHSIADGSRFYFVHSYYLDAEVPDLAAGVTEYGFSFTSAIARDNLFAMQCHPEKSSDSGLQLLRNFVNWNGQP